MFEFLIETALGLTVVYTFIASGDPILASAGVGTLSLVGLNGYRTLK